MPLDRQIEITYEGAGSRNRYGEYVPGTKTIFKVWANRMDLNFDSDQQPEGKRSLIRRRYRVRWIHELSHASPSQIVINDGTIDATSHSASPLPLDCDGITEVTGKYGEQRRRYLDIDLIWSS